MTYIILQDTFGSGLDTIPNIGLNVIDEHNLNEWISDAAEILLVENDQYESISDYEEDGNPLMGETIVVCEVLERIKGQSAETYIQDAIRIRENIKKQGEYELYLKLKEKFKDA